MNAMNATATCAECGKVFQTWKAWLKRKRNPTCSRQCNGQARGREWGKHAHKAFAARTPEGRQSYRRKMSGPKNPAWKGGVMTRRGKGNYAGARYVRCPVAFAQMARKDGYVMEHRLVMALRVGRPLTRTEVVHHMDHDPRNNVIANLELWPDNRSHKLAEHGRHVEGAANRLFRTD